MKSCYLSRTFSTKSRYGILFVSLTTTLKVYHFPCIFSFCFQPPFKFCCTISYTSEDSIWYNSQVELSKRHFWLLELDLLHSWNLKSMSNGLVDCTKVCHITPKYLRARKKSGGLVEDDLDKLIFYNLSPLSLHPLSSSSPNYVNNCCTCPPQLPQSTLLHWRGFSPHAL